jgi:hypothetical protein
MQPDADSRAANGPTIDQRAAGREIPPPPAVRLIQTTAPDRG